MAQKILVTPEELEKAALKIRDLAADYQDQYNKLYQKTGDLVQTWDGDDNKAFVNRIAEFKPDLIMMYNLMIRYAEYLEKTAKSYRDTQQEIIRQAGSLRN